MSATPAPTRERPERYAECETPPERTRGREDADERAAHATASSDAVHAEVDHAIRDLDEPGVVRREHDGRVARKLCDRTGDQRRARRVQVRRRLVEQQQRSAGRERAREREPADLARRERRALAENGAEPVRERGDDGQPRRRARAHATARRPDGLRALRARSRPRAAAAATATRASAATYLGRPRRGRRRRRGCARRSARAGGAGVPSRLVLPAPLEPATATRSPGSTTAEIPRIAGAARPG